MFTSLCSHNQQSSVASVDRGVAPDTSIRLDYVIFRDWTVPITLRCEIFMTIQQRQSGLLNLERRDDAVLG